VLVDPDHPYAAEPAGVVDEDTLAFGQDRVVGGVPRHGQTLGVAGDGEVLAHDAFQRPPQPAAAFTTTTTTPLVRLDDPAR
jgi:hypothetical protein